MTESIKIPNLGDASEATVVEVLVTVGQSITEEQPLIVLEGEKATMEIPATQAGVVATIDVQVGDTVATGDAFLTLQTSESKAAATVPSVDATSDNTTASTASAAATAVAEEPEAMALTVPDLGDAGEGTLVEMLVNVGDCIVQEQPLVILEGEKATMEIPATQAGTITAIDVQVGDVLKSGQAIGQVHGIAAATAPAKQSVAPSQTPAAAVVAESPKQATAPVAMQPMPTGPVNARVYAGPSVRRMARRLGVDLAYVKGAGRKGRILRTDVEAFVRQQLSMPSGDGLNLADWPTIEPGADGPVDVQPLAKIRKISGSFLHRNWVRIPHVTQFDQADVTDLEAWRKAHKGKAQDLGCKISPLLLVMKALVESLKAFPQFNASLSEDGASLILKQYYHIGVAVDSPNGLMVPVIRDVDQKDLVTLAKEVAMVAEQARTKGLAPQQMKGSSFTVSSLGGIGGTAFTPIVNAPDVAILGLSKTQLQPVFEADAWVPRLMLPLSLSYDHRAIDGADGARFIVDLAKRLAMAHAQAAQWWPSATAKGE